MTKKQRAAEAIRILKKKYPAECSLCVSSPLELLISVRLAAQCTDARVNLVTPTLFARYKNAAEFANADIDDVAEIIKSCGLYRTKARDIVLMCRELINRFGGEVPESMEDLLSLPGIGRKCANLIRGDVFGHPAVVADTHCIRIANRLGLCDTKDPKKVEMALVKLLPPEESSDFCHRMVLFGRDVCTARAPKCGDCPLADVCGVIFRH